MHCRGRDSYNSNCSRANLLDCSDRTRRKKKRQEGKKHREERPNGRIICRQKERGMRDNQAPHSQKTADICDHERRQSKGILPKHIQEIERFYSLSGGI